MNQSESARRHYQSHAEMTNPILRNEKELQTTRSLINLEKANQELSQLQSGNMSTSLYSNNTNNFRPNFDTLSAPKPQEFQSVSAGNNKLAIDPNAKGLQVTGYSNNGTVSFNNGTSTGGNSSLSSNSSSSSTSSSNLGMTNGSLQSVFTDLGKIAEDKAGNDQRRFREDLPYQARVYQDFDTEAAGRTEGIDTRAREQNSSLTKDRMRLQSTQNMAEEKNRGQVQANTTGQTRDSDLKRALSVLPRK